MEKYDAIIIGGGSGGYAAARTLRETLDSVAIIDDAEELGGLCILRGCMPSKTLIYSTEVLHLAQKGQRFGLDIPSAAVDMKRLHERKVRLIQEFKAYRQEQLQSDAFTLLRERAAFINPNTIRLQPSGRELTADRFVVATGSVVNYPDIPGLDLDGIWTSDDVLDLDVLPESVIVLGGGIVACELAQFLNRAGSRVIQIQRSEHILKETSVSAAETIEQAFKDEGIALHTGTQLKRIEKTGKGFTVFFEDGQGSCNVSAQHVVNALGRNPNTGQLGLKEAGILQHPNGQIRVNAYQQTDNPHVYAVGDVTGPYEIVHIAIMQGEVAGRHATSRPTDPVDLDTRTSVVFTDPQIASAGLSIEECAMRGLEVKVADYPFDDHGKSILMEAKYGFVKVWSDKKTGHILGAECVGKDAGELIHAMAVGITLKATASDLLKVHWYHPTLSEIWSYPLEDLVDLVEN